MGESIDRKPTVLVVDDEQDVADAYATQIEDRYDVRVAYGGEAALEMMSDDVDAVLLDRRMPDVHGDEVLERIREDGYNCKVIMITAVDADLNILEMDFDDYLSKPVGKETLRTTLANHVTPAREDPRLEEFFSLIAKLEVLEAEKTKAQLQRHDDFKQMAQRAQELADELREEVEDFEALVEAHRNVGRSPTGNDPGPDDV